AQNRDGLRGERYAVRDAVLRALRRNRPPGRVEVNVLPLHRPQLATALPGEQEQLEQGRVHGSIALGGVPDRSKLVGAQYAVSLMLGRWPLHTPGRVVVLRDQGAVRGCRPVENATDERERPVRGDGRASVHDAVDQLAHVAG